ncbi:MAG: galactokinase [Dictyoglomus sp.]|nr:galactokinase [Dictyoglomus sp.]MCX7942198.1 galactokinase [Dictyoglomaceae bacterium]MDW8188661.1 galactokinase [Dictyoglomus sp.]
MNNNLKEFFGSLEKVRGVRAPGRVNLIGEHTDYHLGYVLPCAINRYFYFFLRENNTKRVKIYSENFSQAFQFELNNIEYSYKYPWSNYLLGVIKEIIEKVGEIPGFDGYIYSEIPMGAGLSSSAAYEVSVAFGLKEYFQLPLNLIDIVKLSQKAENEFVGARCGIMDQFISAFGKKDHALLLDTRNLEYEYIPFDIKSKDLELVIVDTKVKHSIAGEGYTKRREEGEKALEILRNYLPINSLRDLDEEGFSLSQKVLPDPLKRRVEHVYRENQRVLNFVKALKENKWEELDKYMVESHNSLRYLYEVTCEELDFLFEKAHEYYAFTSRMTGGGFGGSTINLVFSKMLNLWCQKIEEAYRLRFGFSPEILILETANGVGEINL